MSLHLLDINVAYGLIGLIGLIGLGAELYGDSVVWRRPGSIDA